MAATAGPRIASGRTLAARPGVEPNASVVDRDDLTASITRFTIRPDDGVPPFEPGQYFALGLTVGGTLLQRPYSTSSAPGRSGGLEFLVRLVPDGVFTPRLWGLQIGDRLRIGRPKGLFKLTPGDTRRHLFVATGTGLAPFVSMVDALLADQPAGPIDGEPPRPRPIVVHGVSHVAELAFRDRFERLVTRRPEVSYVPIVSRPTHPANAGWAGLSGRLETQLDVVCDTHRVDPTDTVAYLCGNPEMIAAAQRILGRRGFVPEAMVCEQYWPSV